MARIVCICGNHLSDACGDDGHCFSGDPGYFHEDSNEYRGILECNECGTLAIEDPKNSCYVKWYKPENGKFNRLFHE
jgi:hypothetical protein